MGLFAMAVITATPALDPANAVRAKLRLIQSGKARAGSALTFTSGELNAYARSEVPEGVRQTRLELANGSASGYALIDFLKVQRGGGGKTPWLIERIIEGERPVRVDAKLQSAGGKATVFLQRVEISGLAVSGPTLDFLIENFFTPLYPNARINQPFELNDRVDHIEVNREMARVVMRR